MKELKLVFGEMTQKRDVKDVLIYEMILKNINVEDLTHMKYWLIYQKNKIKVKTYE